ncbi:hypothetical protein BDN72DRAFT_802049 [Pluteus cervinus]|uniref:Uncharacterized protein n=1 Tax=Pluteus cervinus TaxID=181527 RepID=A0ACD3AF62_9AGAR|nr:hypothetical protein BDN72DRAFT_802049 [Pluteus cervinus]
MTAQDAGTNRPDPQHEKLAGILGELGFSLAPEDLSRSEIWWRDHQPWLETCGYTLRDRYKPGWIPSWTQGIPKLYAQDWMGVKEGHLMDAIRVIGNKNVMLKKVSRSTHPYEVELTAMWTEPHLINHPHNHCVRLVEVLSPPDDPDIAILVLPLFRNLFRPRFQTIGEAVEFFRQVFEGLKFIHENHVAHRDCNYTNIMMDGNDMYPEGWHVSHPDHAPGPSSFAKGKAAKHFTRTEKPPKYYFIDFGISRRYDASDTAPIEDIIRGGDKSPPEFQNPTGRCNPFPTDVYCLGNTLRLVFIEGGPDPEFDRPGHYGLEFMQPLVKDMVHEDPTKRPTMDEVIQRFHEILRNLSSWRLRSRLIPFREPTYKARVRTGLHWKKTLGYTLQGIPPVPIERDR